MTYIVSSGALNSTPTNSSLSFSGSAAGAQQSRVVLRESFGEVREEQVGFVTLALAVLDRLVVEERVQLDRLVRSRAVLVLTTANDTHRFNFFSLRLANKPSLIWLLITPPHLKCVATLPRNLSSMACFAGINVSRGSVAIYARCGGIVNRAYPFNYKFTKESFQ